MLDRYRKGITVQDNDRAIAILEEIGGITIHLGYIIFDPDLTLEELHENYLWLRQCPHAMVSNFYNRLNAYCGIPITETLLKEGRLCKGHFSERWSYTFKDNRVQSLWEIIEHYRRNVLSDITRKVNHLILLIKRELNNPHSTTSRPHTLLDMQKTLELEQRSIWHSVFDEAFSICSSFVPERQRLAQLQADIEQRATRLEEVLSDITNALGCVSSVDLTNPMDLPGAVRGQSAGSSIL